MNPTATGRSVNGGRNLNVTDPKLAAWTWQEVMDHLAAKKKDHTRRRWKVAIKDKNFDRLRHVRVAETPITCCCYRAAASCESARFQGGVW